MNVNNYITGIFNIGSYNHLDGAYEWRLLNFQANQLSVVDRFDAVRWFYNSLQNAIRNFIRNFRIDLVFLINLYNLVKIMKLKMSDNAKNAKMSFIK